MPASNNPGFLIALQAALCAGALGCGDNVAAVSDAAPDAPVAGQGSEPLGDLIITEVSPRGEGPDWIEIRNRTDSPIDLCDFFITDSVDRLDHYLPLGVSAPPDACEPRPLGPGEFLIIEADDDVAAGPTHAPFRLGEADEVHIVDLSGRATDSIVYLFARGSTPPGYALARVPTNSGLFFLVPASPGEPNPESLP